MGPKIATCSYCGTRAALVLDRGRHELTCSACGAPLHDMKAMPQSPVKAAKKAPTSAPVQPRRRRKAHDEHERESWFGHGGQARRKPRKRRKPMARRMLEELWDVVEDIFD